MGELFIIPSMLFLASLFLGYKVYTLGREKKWLFIVPLIIMGVFFAMAICFCALLELIGRN